MAIPRVFISSTCYDLKYIRENLKYFVRTLGHEAVLSEEGTIFFDPRLDTQQSCLAEVPNCQLFVLIIGGRFGSSFKGEEHSITNAEYREAIRLRIPVFALVDQGVHSDFQLYLSNRDNVDIDATKILYPSVDSIEIFDFVDEVRLNAVNNALIPFSDFSDIETYLRQQWAAMMYSFLTEVNEHSRVSDAFDAISGMSARIEILSKQILNSVGTEDAKLEAKLYEEMIASEAIRDLAYWDLKPSPLVIFQNETFQNCALALGVNVDVEDDKDGHTITTSGQISRMKFDDSSGEYIELRERLGKILHAHGKSQSEYMKERTSL